MTNKITKKDYYNMLLSIEEVKANEDMVNFINHELDLLARKSKSGSNKPTKRQVENTEVLIPAILDFLATVERATATEVAKGVNVEFEVSTSRATSALQSLKKTDKVVNEKIKGVSYYSVAE